MREIRDESDNEDNEGVEADAGGMLHGGVWFSNYLLYCQKLYNVLLLSWVTLIFNSIKNLDNPLDNENKIYDCDSNMFSLKI